MFLETKEISVSDSRANYFHDIARGIRQGCKQRPVQAFCSLFEADAACVWGALIVANYALTRTIGEDDRTWDCPLASEHNSDMDSYRGVGVTLRNIMIHLNDVHRKPREWIADWVDNLS